MGVSVKTMTVLSRTIFSSAGDKRVQKMSSCIESYDCVEACNAVWRILTCRGVFCDRACSYIIGWHMLQGELNQTT